MNKINRSTLSEQVAEQLIHMIADGKWKVGDKLPPEPELCRSFNVGRNALREAVKALVHSGLLESRQGIGTIVKATDDLAVLLERKIHNNDLLEAFEVRLCLEREAARLAAMRRNGSDLEQLTAALKNCKTAAASGDAAAFLQADLFFHKTVAIAAHNSLLALLYEHISEAQRKSVNAVLGTDSPLMDEIHLPLFEAIKAQDAAQAADCVDRDLKKALNALKDISNE